MQRTFGSSDVHPIKQALPSRMTFPCYRQIIIVWLGIKHKTVFCLQTCFSYLAFMLMYLLLINLNLRLLCNRMLPTTCRYRHSIPLCNLFPTIRCFADMYYGKIRELFMVKTQISLYFGDYLGTESTHNSFAKCRAIFIDKIVHKDIALCASLL